MSPRFTVVLAAFGEQLCKTINELHMTAAINNIFFISWIVCYPDYINLAKTSKE
jgi:hypothetical protein